MLSILEIIEDTTVDGPGFRTSVYAAGCHNGCPGCHNPQSWNIDNGTLMSTDEILAIILADPFADVTFTGGDPMFQPEGFTELAKAVKEHSEKSIWCYTGYDFEKLVRNPLQRELLQWVDVLVDGRFVQELRDENLRFRGSSNQRVIDVPKSLEVGSVVLYDLEGEGSIFLL